MLYVKVRLYIWRGIPAKSAWSAFTGKEFINLKNDS